MFILKRTTKYHDAINDCTDPEKTEGKQIEDTSANLANVEAMEAQRSEEEAQQAVDAGLHRVWLGSRILRCETAPTAAISILMYLTKNL